MIVRPSFILQASKLGLLVSLLVFLFAGILPANLSVYAAPVAQGVQRIRFASGATSAVVNGGVNAGQVTRYVLTAMAGKR